LASLLPFFAIIISVWFIARGKSTEKKNDTVQPRRVMRPEPAADIPRRAQIARNQRRNRPEAAANNAESSEEDEDYPHSTVVLSDEKMGAKKRAKLEAKAEKRHQRELEQQAREEKKKRDDQLEAERKKEASKEDEAERKREDAERLAREEKERREHEEYLKLKATFQVDEEGYDECGDEEKESLLMSFINYIQDNKVVLLEDLATHFKLKTQAVIDRITDLQESGTLTGVIDDQGKFIYISDGELTKIGEFIRNRGRVSISELAESSNNLVTLTPVTNTVPVSSN